MASVVEIPRGPIFNEKSGSIDTTDQYVSKMLRWREQAQEEAVATLRMHKEYENVQQYLDMIEGRQWDKRRPKYRSQFIDNRMAKARYDGLAVLSDVKPVLDVSCRVKAYQQHGKIVNNVIRAEWVRQNMILELIRCVDHAFLGTGYWKMSAASPGYMGVKACGMDSVLPILPGGNIQEAFAVLYRTYKHLAYYTQKFGAQRCKGLEREATSTLISSGGQEMTRPNYIDEFTWNALSPALRYKLGVRVNSGRQPGGTSMFQSIELQEFYVDDPATNDSSQTVRVKHPDLPIGMHNYHYTVAPRQRLFPRKRLIVFGGNRMMYDGPGIYWHGQYPFPRLELNPVPWAHGGLSKYRNLVPINKAINEIVAGVLDQIRRAINPPIIVRDNAVSREAWNQYFPDLPGSRLRMNANANPQQDLRYGEIPNLPSYVYVMLSQLLFPEFDRHAGSLDITGVQKKLQVPGADTIEAMRDSLQTPVRLEALLLEQFLVDAGYQAVSNVFQFYSTEMRLRMLGDDGTTFEDFDYNPGSLVPFNEPREDHWKLFTVNIAQGSLLGSSKDRDKQLAVVLFKLQAIDQQALLETLEWGDIDKIIARMQARQQAMAQQQASIEAAKNAGGGGGAGAPPFDLSALLGGAGGGDQGGDTPRLGRQARNGGI